MGLLLKLLINKCVVYFSNLVYFLFLFNEQRQNKHKQPFWGPGNQNNFTTHFTLSIAAAVLILAFIF
jgi:hypothetical protein